MNGLCPADIFFGGMVPRHSLKDLQVWGCPVFVLNPKLQLFENEKNNYGKASRNQNAALKKMRTQKTRAMSQNNGKQD